MSAQQQQQNIFTIHESQLNSSGGGGGARASQSDILIDTSSIPLTQQATMPPMQHHQHSLQPTNVQQQFDMMTGGQSNNGGPSTITSQPMQQHASSSAKVAPEAQNVVYSVHPVFSLLDQQDALLVRQRAEASATCCGFESANTYTVRARDGTPILRAVESSNCCERCCFETNREYNLSLVHGEETVARIRKAHHVSRFCCYSNSVRIESPEDNPIGHIRQQFTMFGHSKYAIFDCQLPANKPSFVLESESCRLCCTPLLCTCLCSNTSFRIVSTEKGEQVGKIERTWSDADQQQQQQSTTEAGQQLVGDDQDNDGQGPFVGQPQSQMDEQQKHRVGPNSCQLFGIQFEPQLEARQKVLLLSACFMMDFFYFEHDRQRRKLANC